MKKTLLILLMMCSFQLSMNAQEVYSSIRAKAQQTLDDPKAVPLLKKFSQFKVDALDYMVMKMKEVMPDSSATYLDDQAFALENFMTLYIKQIIDTQKEPQAFQIKVIKLFMDASYSNPLFFDTDKDLVLCYFSDGSSLTRFSLDTDWLRAFVAASTELRKLK